MTGALWARIVGIIVAGISMIVNLAFFQALPLLAVVIIAMDVVIIYALAVHGGELKAEHYRPDGTRYGDRGGQRPLAAGVLAGLTGIFKRD